MNKHNYLLKFHWFEITSFSLRKQTFLSFSSLFAAEDVSQGGTFATQQQKFHTEDVNQRLHNKSDSHGVPNAKKGGREEFLATDVGPVRLPVVWC